MNVINKDNVGLFAYFNDSGVNGDIKGIILEFHGLGGGEAVIKTPDEFARACAERGILYVFPYYGPWSWMNDTAVKTTDDIVSALIARFSLREDIPLVSSGQSMGGCSALTYTSYARKTPIACAANCPVCDLAFHYTEREDLPRTMLSAFGHYNCELTEAIKTASPIERIGSMPDIDYFVAHCTADKEVNKALHSDKFVRAMRAKNYKLDYLPVPDRGHCDLSPEAREQYNGFMFEKILKEN